jgi:signal transduction histidine kinase
MTRLAALISFTLILFFLSGCDKPNQDDLQSYKKNDVLKLVCQTICANTTTGLGSIFIDNDSIACAEMAQRFTHASRFFEEGEGYVFIETRSGYNISHPANPELQGNSTTGIVDADGKYIVQDMIDLVNYTGFGFLEYRYKNPANDEVEYKTTFVDAIENSTWYAGCGFYHIDYGNLYTQRMMNEEVVKNAVISMAGGVRALLDNYAQDSLQGVYLMRDFLRHIRFFDNQSGYFYVIDYNGYNVVQPPDPSIQGTYEWDIVDSRGNYLVRGLVETAQDGGGFYSYYWEDYQSGEEKMKTAFVMPVEGYDYLIGSGVYSK